MHSKKKGNIGQFAIALELSKLGYSIFTEEGDISKIDLIAEKNSKILKIQCKAITPVDDCLIIYLVKSGPGYKFKYDCDMFDFFGIYDLEDGKTYLVPSSVLKNHKNAFKLRKVKPKNNQGNVNFAEHYTVDKFL